MPARPPLVRLDTKCDTVDWHQEGDTLQKLKELAEGTVEGKEQASAVPLVTEMAQARNKMPGKKKRSEQLT